MKSRNKTLLGYTLIAGGIAVLLLNSCSAIPKDAKPVDNFDLTRYLGTWYEIARFDFRFEKNLDNTMAQYSLDKNGNVIVLNSGYNYVKDKWTSAEGLARFRGDKNIAALKVSFFGPFYSGYNVIALDKDFKYERIKQEYLKIAEEVGYDTSNLIWVKHDRKSPFDE